MAALQYTKEDLSKLSQEELARLVLSQQEQLARLNANMESLIEQIRIANADRFGRKTEKLYAIAGQLSFFNEAEAFSDDTAAEPDAEEVLPAKRKKQKGQREEDLKGFPAETYPHELSEEELDRFYGTGNWRELPVETYKRLRYEPSSWTVEIHDVHVYVGTDGDHQDEFKRGDRPKDLIRNSIVTPSLGAAILNGKYVNALPLYRISQEFERNGVNLSRQTMANWVIAFADCFKPLWELMKKKLLSLPVTQADETTVDVIRDGRAAGAKSYMWVHRSGEYYTDQPMVLYEYQKTRHHDHPKEFYKDYRGVLLTDGLQQYHLLEQELPVLINANCWAHARRDFADACKAIGKTNPAMKTSTAHQALELIGAIFNEDGKLRELSGEERLRERQIRVRPLVEAYFSWVREQLSDQRHLPKGKTAEGLRYSLNQETYLKVFLENGDVPMDNSASERSIRSFCIGRNNWVLINSIKGAQASATIYSLSETAKLNGLNVYEYFKKLLSELPNRKDEDGNIDPSTLADLLPWSETIQNECRKRR